MKTLYPVQERHVKRLVALLAANNAALDQSDTGTGKTLCGIHVAKQIGLPVLIICPKAVIPAWKREMEEQKLEGEVINYEKIRTGNTKWMQWDGKGKHMVWKLPSQHLVIFDEAHKCAGMRTQNAELLMSAVQQNHKVLLLSATIASSPLQLRAAGFALGLFPLREYVPWIRALGVSAGGPFGDVWNRSEANQQKLASLIAPKASRMTRNDLKDHFKETQIDLTPLDFGNALAKCFHEMEAELAELEEKQASDRGANALVIQLRARQKTELLKVPMIEELVEDALAEGKSVAVFVNFQQTLDSLAERFPSSCQVHGKQTAKERQNAIDAFQNDKARIILLNSAAGGTGVSLHDTTGKFPRLAIICPDWDEKKIVQVMGRVHRAGGKTDSQQRVLFAAGTIEEQISQSLRKKIDTMDILNEETAKATQTELPAPLPEKPPVPVAKAEPNHSERKHATYSPSSLKMFEACPSFKKTEGSSVMAEIGTRIHEAIESNNMRSLSAEEAELADMCIQFRDQVRAEKTDSGLQIAATFEEVKINIDLGPVKTFGSFDWLEIYSDGSAILLDWKTGYHAVDDAETNAQVWAYTLGILQKHPEIKQIDCYLVMPRRGEVSHGSFTRADMGRMKLRLSTIILRAQEQSGKIFTPKEGVCDYCSNRGSCQALAETALVLSQKSGFSVPESVDLTSASPADKAALYKLAVLMEKWCEDTKRELLRQSMEEGLTMPGYRLETRKTPRTIDAPIIAWEAVKNKISIEEFLSCATRISVASLENLYAEKAPQGKKGVFKEAINMVLEDAGALKPQGAVHVLKAERA